MGNLFAGNHPPNFSGSSTVTIPPLLEETQIFALWTITDVRELLKRFQTQIHGFAIVEAQFEMILSFKPEVAEHVELELLFSILDNDHDGRMDGLEFLGGLALCCHATFEEKCRFCFELFDFNLNSLLSEKELIMMMMSSVCGMNLLTGGGEELEPDLDVFESLAAEAIKRADGNADGQISYEEFVAWARSNRELMAGLEALNRIALDAKLDVQSEDSAPETEEDSHSDLEEDETIENPIKPEGGDQSTAAAAWLGQIQEPTNFKPHKDAHRGPKTNLELVWSYGFNCRTHPNNVRYLFHSTYPDDVYIVYFSAAVCVVYDSNKKTQIFYLGHKSEVTAVEIHPNQQIVATADKDSTVHIWTLDSNKQPSAVTVFESMVKNGIQQLKFSPSGDRIAVIGMDNDHTICLHNSLNGEVISSGKGISNPNNVNDLAFSLSGSEIIMVGKSQIRFYINTHTNKRSLEWRIGHIGKKGKRQNFYSAAYLKDEAVVGCASGEIYKFRDGVCVAIVQAHGVKDPVYCLSYSVADSTLLSGGKDCIVKTWDLTLKEIGTAIDLCEDLTGDGKPELGSLKSAVRSVQHFKSKILIGTFGSDIFEAVLSAHSDSPYAITKIASGHSAGELWGLAAHPTRDEFCTVGDDLTLRLWSLRTHEQVNARSMPKAARAVAYSPSGTVICVGMMDGEVSLVESTSPGLRAYSTWQHSEELITDIKFSPDGNYLATASADTNIYLYKTTDQKNFTRSAVCKGHTGAVTHIDFSSNSQYLQSNGLDYSLLFWSLNGNQVIHSFSMKDIVWATNTCVFGWSVQGIWPEQSGYSDINCCLALPDIGDIVTGDDSHKINLFSYPALSTNAVHQSYVGHAGPVTAIKSSWNKRYIMSAGGTDRTILLWRHDVELEDSDDEAEENHAHHNKPVATEVALVEENPTVAPRTIHQEAANLGWSVDDLKSHIVAHEGVDALHPHAGDQAEETPQWRSKIIEPTVFTSSQSSTDVDLTLKWIHGHRCHDCRNNVIYSSDGSVVYNAANVGVLYHKPTGKQRFLLGPHVDEIISITVHPAGQIFATGEAGRKANIIVWNSTDMSVLSKIENVHEGGVPLLAFNTGGILLASVGLDANNTLTIHDWNKGLLIASTPTNAEAVLCCCFLLNDQLNLHSAKDGVKSVGHLTGKQSRRSGASVPNGNVDRTVNFDDKDVVVTGGEKGFLKFWWWQGSNISSQAAVWGADPSLLDPEDKHSTILSVASTNSSICVTGLGNGNLLIWKDCKLVGNTRKSLDKYLDEEATGLKTIDSHVDIASIPKPSASPKGKLDLKGIQKTSNYPHRSPILAMHAIRGTIDTVIDGDYSGYEHSSRYITGDKDGVVCIWRLIESTLHSSPGTFSLVLIKRFELSQFQPKPTTNSVKSIWERDGLILIGNNSSEIFEIHDDSIHHVNESHSQEHGNPHLTTESKVNPPSRKNSHHTLAIAVGDPLPPPLPTLTVNQLTSGHGKGELWGFAIHPVQKVFFTSGDDNYLRCWNLQTNALVSYARLPDKSRALAIKPKDEVHLAVSLNTGDVVIINTEVFLNPDEKPSFRNGIDPTVANRNISDKLKVLEDFSVKIEGAGGGKAADPKLEAISSVATTTALAAGKPTAFKCLILQNHPAQWSQVMKYSFDGQLLAIGSHDNKIYLYRYDHSTNNYPFLFTVNVHSSFITHIDFGISLQIGKLIQDGYDQTIHDPTTKEIIGHVTKTVTEQYDEEHNVIKRSYTIQKHYFDTSLHPDEETVEAEKNPIPVTADYLVGQSTSGNGELFYWKCKDGSPINSPNDIKDVKWESFTCSYGWPIQGLYNPENSLETITSILAVTRSFTFETVPVLAVGDIYGRLRLFNYPCISYGAPDKTYKAHSGKITNLGFSDDDTYLVSVGGTDRCIMVWETDIQDEIRSRKAFTFPTKPNASSGIVAATSVTHNQNNEEEHSPHLYEESLDHILSQTKGNDTVPSSSSNSLAVVTGGSNTLDIPSGGDEFQAIKPWKGVIREPSNYKEDPEITASKNGKLPKAILELKYAYGYRGFDSRNNLFYGSHLDQIIYPTASLGVVFNTKENKQIFNTEHTADIISLAVHPDGHTVATGEVGKFPKIVLWDTHTGTTIKVIKYHKIGVSQVAFHPNSLDLLISVGLDDDRMLVVHNFTTGTVVGKSKIGKGISVHVLRCCPYSGSDTFLTAGKNHLKFWDLPATNSPSPGGELSSKTGIYNLKSVKTRTVCSCAYLGIDPITGMDDGSLLLWKDRTNTKCIANAHTGPITAMASIISNQNNPNANTTSSNSNANTSALNAPSGSNTVTRPIDGRDAGPRIVTGSKDGFIHIWDIQLNCVWTLNLNDTNLANLSSSLLVNAPASANASSGNLPPPPPPVNPLLIPCVSQVQSLDVKDNLLLIGTKSSEIFEIHLIGSSNTNSISSSITNNQFICHMKGHFQERSELWGLAIHPKLSYFVTAGDDMTIRLWDSKYNECKSLINIQSKTRAICYSSNDGLHIAVGTYDGKVIVLSDDLQRILFTVLLTSHWIHTMTYSPDGGQLAVGAHDSTIYLLETKSYSCRSKCHGHHSYITAMDYSKDSKYLQTTSGDYELLFWNSMNGQQMMNINMIRDILWASVTCPLGWSVQGIWPKFADGTDVNTVDRSPDNQLLVTGDDSHQVKLFAYPVVKENQVNNVYTGHAHHVMKAKFSADGKYVFTVGGMDKTVLQFEVKYC